MAAKILNDVLSGKISYDVLNIWLTGNKKEITPLPGFHEVGCNPVEFTLYFLNLLRDQTIRILQPCQDNATPKKRSDVEAAPTSQNESVDKYVKEIMTDFFPPMEESDASPNNYVNNSRDSKNKKSVSPLEILVKLGLISRDDVSKSESSTFLQSSPTADEPRLPFEFHNRGSPGAYVETGVEFGMAARSREPWRPFQEQVMPVEGASSSNFVEKHDLIRKEWMRLQQNSSPSREDARSRVEGLEDMPNGGPDPDKVDSTEWLNAMARVYSLLLDTNLNFKSEFHFILSLLDVPMPAVPAEHSTPVKCCEAKAMKADPLNSVHNCVYFSVLVLNLQRHRLAVFDRSSIFLLVVSPRIAYFNPELYKYLLNMLWKSYQTAMLGMVCGRLAQACSDKLAPLEAAKKK